MWWNFKFQSDSINTIRKGPGTNYAWTFKFQSDSINTDYPPQILLRRTTLNSNLILLIPTRAGITDVFQSAVLEVDFKFQSDSINTSLGGMQSRLISTFKFQSDSINTGNTGN